MENSVMRS